ncbi:transposase [Streptomyces rhizosphaerihabitans]|uniref:transposase n=1 Tax=Streptomyces rhizosphaerihabitans TaxID=1266770 RepID=UPI0037041055
MDVQWRKTEPFLPGNGRSQWADHRRAFNGVLFRARTGVPWPVSGHAFPHDLHDQRHVIFHPHGHASPWGWRLRVDAQRQGKAQPRLSLPFTGTAGRPAAMGSPVARHHANLPRPRRWHGDRLRSGALQGARLGPMGRPRRSGGSSRTGSQGRSASARLRGCLRTTWIRSGSLREAQTPSNSQSHLTSQSPRPLSPASSSRATAPAGHSQLRSSPARRTSASY